jgi:hypothetical protein
MQLVMSSEAVHANVQHRLLYAYPYIELHTLQTSSNLDVYIGLYCTQVFTQLYQILEHVYKYITILYKCISTAYIYVGLYCTQVFTQLYQIPEHLCKYITILHKCISTAYIYILGTNFLCLTWR